MHMAISGFASIECCGVPNDWGGSLTHRPYRPRRTRAAGLADARQSRRVRAVRKAADWRNLVEDLGIDTRIPDIVRAKFARAQTLHMLGWVDFSVVKAGELA